MGTDTDAECIRITLLENTLITCGTINIHIPFSPNHSQKSILKKQPQSKHFQCSII